MPYWITTVESKKDGDYTVVYGPWNTYTKAEAARELMGQVERWSIVLKRPRAGKVRRGIGR